MFRLNLPNKTQITVLTLIIFFIGAYYLGLDRYSNYYFRLILNPLIISSNYLSRSLADFFSVYLNASDCAAENDRLNEKIITLSRENVALRFLKEENKNFRQALSFTEDLSASYVVARVIGQPLGGDTTEILINKGRQEGLEKNQAVTSSSGVIIGKIDTIGENYAQVRLLIDNQSKLAVFVYGNEPGNGLAEGEHNLNLLVSMLDKNLLIKEGDLVATSGLEENIPAGLVVGRVTRIDNNEEKIWQDVLVEPALDYKTLNLVTVILSPKKI